MVWKNENTEPFGNSLPNENPSGFGNFEFNQGFPGQYRDKETGTFYNYHRDYDPAVGRYLQSDPVGLMAGVSTYGYVEGSPLSKIDPLGLWAWGDPIPKPIADGVVGFGDGASLGLTRLYRYWRDIDGGIDPCSDAYRNGGWASFGLGGARLAYAGLARVGAAAASSGLAASAFRSRLRASFGGGNSFRPPDLKKYPTDQLLRDGAGRTNLPGNTWGAGAAAAGGAFGSGCGCDSNSSNSSNDDR